MGPLTWHSEIGFPWDDLIACEALRGAVKPCSPIELYHSIDQSIIKAVKPFIDIRWDERY